MTTHDFTWYEKFKLVNRARAGENIFDVLHTHGISWGEFREWFEAYKLRGPEGLKIRHKYRRTPTIIT